MNSLVIIGASGFLGRALIGDGNLIGPVKAIARNIPEDIGLHKKKVTWVKFDFTSCSSLAQVLSEGDVVINLAYIQDGDRLENVSLVDKIIKACIYAKVSRLVHCSTAVVIGDVKTNLINELSLCNPKTPYEKTKLILEDHLLSAASKDLDVVVLRPTAVVGYGGKNLLKLTHSLLYGSRIINYIKICVLNNMPMHIVPVRNVVSALLYVSFYPKRFDGEVFIVSSDEDVDNNFQKINEILLHELGLNSTKFPYIILPRILQSLLFKLIKRNDINMNRTYDSKKISDYGFEPNDSVNEAVRQFARSIKQDNLTDKKVLANDN